jgi:hypothetical protein
MKKLNDNFYLKCLLKFVKYPEEEKKKKKGKIDILLNKLKKSYI